MEDESGQTELPTVLMGLLDSGIDRNFLPGFGIWSKSHGPIMFRIQKCELYDSTIVYFIGVCINHKERTNESMSNLTEVLSEASEGLIFNGVLFNIRIKH